MAADMEQGWQPWIADYFARYTRAAFSPELLPSLVAFHDLALAVRARGRKMMFAGNGASASIASHAAVDFSKQGRVRAVDFNEPNLITCLSNDYGYENWVARAIELYGDEGDVVVLISVSGQSVNLLRAAEYAASRGMTVVTFTGKREDNALKALGSLNFWLDSESYNVVEGVHMIWITTVIDMVVGRAEYSVT